MWKRIISGEKAQSSGSNLTGVVVAKQQVILIISVFLKLALKLKTVIIILKLP